MTFEESKPAVGNSEQRNEFRAGFVAIAGKPNVGKSTLMNALIGAKVSAVSRRPQTTREQIKGILTRDNGQIVFVDMPGLIQPRDRFNECLMEQAVEALRDVDLLYHLVEADDPAPLSPEVAESLARVKCPRFLVVNKIDRLDRNAPRETPALSQIVAHYDETFWISALTGQGLPQLLERTMARLPVHPPYYEGDELTDRDARFLAAEIVREKLFELTGQEVPYSIATECEEFKERAEQKHYIRVRIYVERESQKKLVIGADGRVLKKVGELARKDIEALLGHPVYLELWVKVLKNWRKNEADLRRLGYKISHSKR
ncbi:MAG: GTPase Era [Candidatus Sumerlaeia bacterium]|nr:GTPase Era [Candidatus Sumerlaeia bacterium]